MKYSIRGQYPISVLPHRIRLLDGSTRTDSSTFTSTDLTNAGITTVSESPAYDQNTHKLTWNKVDNDWEVVSLTEGEVQQIVDSKWENIRENRNRLLSEIDEQILRYQSEVRIGITTTTDDISDLDTYAQMLRDIPSTYSNPDDVVWDAPGTAEASAEPEL